VHPVADETPVVELRGLSRTYGADPPVEALRAVDLVVERGDAISIAGPSGSGKSTLLNILGCLDRQTSGTYLFEGIDTASLDEDARAAVRGRRIGFVFQTFNLLAHRTAVENVMLAEVYVGVRRERRREHALAALERVGLADRGDFLPGKLSGGQQQRVAIARALMGEPSVLLCDEPTGNLDSGNTASVLGLFEELVDDRITILVITHDSTVAERMPRRTSITDGRLTEEA
jgi:putative ABC transport system ATP-binding protein